MKLKTPSHLFAGCDGSLYDTRKTDWHKAPALRPVYCSTFREITNTQELKATLRNGGFAWPGGYPLFFLTSDGETLSFEALQDRTTLRCVLDSIKTKANDGWRVVACEVNWEDQEMFCADTAKRIAPAYGE